MIYVVQWTEADHFAPKDHAFWNQDAAEHFAARLRERGRHHVTTHQLDATEQRENR